jgi:hypothetical protein
MKAASPTAHIEAGLVRGGLSLIDRKASTLFDGTAHTRAHVLPVATAGGVIFSLVSTASCDRRR